MEQEEKSFKVVDKRASQGAEQAQPKTSEEVEPKRQLSFSLFVQSLAHQAMVGLGIAPWPDTGLVKVDNNLSKEMIDLLLILQEKTANNLSKEEQELLDTLVYQLQVAFVEITKESSILIK